MELPIELRLEIEKRLENQDTKILQQNAEEISLKYRTESGSGKRLVTQSMQVLSYAAVRMPATYGAVHTVIEKLIEILPDFKPTSLLDVGSGTGAGTWAISRFFDLKDVICLEREREMRELGSSLMKISEDETLKNANWAEFDLTKHEISTKADIVIASYVLNEMDKTEYLKAVQKLWDATNKILIIVEPGTPVGFNEIRTIREELISKGAHIVAPCTHSHNCPIMDDDWCHTTCRVARTKIHKNLKSGNVPYEDEKFSYIVACKQNYAVPNIKLGRVLRHPKIEAGKITLDVCTKQGNIHSVIVTKKDKELFKIVRKAKCGDLI